MMLLITSIFFFGMAQSIEINSIPAPTTFYYIMGLMLLFDCVVLFIDRYKTHIPTRLDHYWTWILINAALGAFCFYASSAVPNPHPDGPAIGLEWLVLLAAIPFGHRLREHRLHVSTHRKPETRVTAWACPRQFQAEALPEKRPLCFADTHEIREEGSGVQVLVRDNNVDQALRALKKKLQREGVFREMKLRGHYEKPSERRAREKAEAVRRARKAARKTAIREGLIATVLHGSAGGHSGPPL